MRRWSVLFVAVTLVAPVRAQSLSEALQAAWRRHPQAVAAGEREAENRARSQLAASVLPGPPTVSLGNLSDRLGRNHGQDEWELELGVPLWLPGQQRARRTEAERASAELDARLAAARLELAGELREAWWSLAAQRQASDLAARRLDSASALEKDVLRRLGARELSRLDANLARTERLTAQAELGEAQAAVRRAELAFNSLAGEAAPAMLAEEALAAEIGAGAPHPRLAAALAAAQLARARGLVAERSRRDAPELAVRYVRERGEFGEAYAGTVGIKLSVPLFSGPRYRQDTAAARAEQLQAETEVELVRRRLDLELAEARRALAQAEAQLALAEERSARTAESLTISERAFALGEFDLTTLLRARAGALEAAAQAGRARIERAAARSRFNQALGVLP